ncbi:MAG: amidohydrolase [Clostridiales bacterium GWC2_40_7]|nr:MAG: amidohydrolase [Clostridiales bacterium GWC2_40_7]
MVVDVHVHPSFFKDICDNPKRVSFRREQTGLYKTGIKPMELIYTQLDAAGINKTVLFAEDLTTLYGDTVISNEEIKTLIDLAPDRFIGFASVDPHRADALEVLDYAFKDLGLMGLKLNLSKQRLFPTDDKLKPIYEKCIKYNKPIMFHAGLSWEPDTLSKYSHPLNFEEVALTYPDLRMCLAHFSWPWVNETVMLLIKYPNVYTDTSMLYLDSPKDFFEQIFMKNMGPLWMDRNFNNKVMFGSNSPRFRPYRLKDALESLDIRRSTIQRILGTNAIQFLGLEV